MIRKIMDLTKIFFVDYFQNLAVVDKKTNRVNKKSVFTWLILIVIFALGAVSYEIIEFLGDIGQQQIFLNAFFLILSFVLGVQTILICTNVFYFSKDLEYVLPLPIKPTHLLIAKFNTVLGVLYTFEAIFALAPLSIYGLMCSNLGYFIYLIPVLLVFPIFISLVVCTFMLFIMKFAKFVKNKDIFQIIVILILTALLTFFEVQIMNNLFTNSESNEIISEETQEGVSQEEVLEDIRELIVNFNGKLIDANKALLVINPCVNILSNPSILSIVEFSKIIVVEVIAFSIFIVVGKNTYLKNILKNVEKVSMNKNNKLYEGRMKFNSEKVGNAYIKKEFKTLVKNPTFFMQCIVPIFVLLIVFIALANIMWPIILDTMELEEMQEVVSQLQFGIDFAVIILCIIQLLFTLSNISITAISREGKNAILMKYIPVSLYKQFVYKNIPQIVLNTIIILTVLVTIYSLAPTIPIIYLLVLFVIAMLINIVNSYLMVIVDLKRPNLDWDSEAIVMKQNNNKLLQYITTIVIIVFLSYFSKVCVDINLNIALGVLMIIFAIVLIIIQKYVKMNAAKLFKNIN